MTVMETKMDWATSAKLGTFRQRVLDWTENDINTGWEDIIVVQGAAELGVHAGDSGMMDWAANWLDRQLEAGIKEDDRMAHMKEFAGTVTGLCLNDYCGNWGFGFAAGAILPVKDEERYRNAILRVADCVLEKARRAPDGCIGHGGFTKNIWVDTLYYCATPLAQAFQVSGVPKYADAAIEQCLLHAKHLRNDATGLWHHDADPETGARTINLWARGNGWILCALADTLRTLPASTGGYGEVMRLYRSQAEAIVRLQHSSGMWRVMPENPNSHLETSGTSMMLTGLLIGVANGWLQPLVLSMVERGLRELETWIDKQGRLMGSQHPAGQGDWDNFKLVPTGENTYTTGFMMRALAAYEQAKVRC